MMTDHVRDVAHYHEESGAGFKVFVGRSRKDVVQQNGTTSLINNSRIMECVLNDTENDLNEHHEISLEEKSDKEPTRYEFEACLTFCCFKFDHVRGVLAFGIIMTLASIAGLGGAFYLLLSLDNHPILANHEDLLTFSAAAFTISVFVHVLVVLSILRHERMMLLPWLFFTSPLIILALIIALIALYIIIFKKNDVSENAWIKLLLSLAFMGFLVYFWSVICSLFVRLADPHDRMHRTKGQNEETDQDRENDRGRQIQ